MTGHPEIALFFTDKGSRSNKSAYHSNQQLTFKSIDLLVLIIVDYIGTGWIYAGTDDLSN